MSCPAGQELWRGPWVHLRRPPGKRPSPPSPIPVQTRPLGGATGGGLASVRLLPFSWTPARKSRSAPGPLGPCSMLPSAATPGGRLKTAALVLVGCGPCSRSQGVGPAEAGRLSGHPDPANSVRLLCWWPHPFLEGRSLPDCDRILAWVPGQCPDQWTCDLMGKRDPLKLCTWRTVESPAFLVTPHLARRGLRHGKPSPMGCTRGPGRHRRVLQPQQPSPAEWGSWAHKPAQCPSSLAPVPTLQLHLAQQPVTMP